MIPTLSELSPFELGLLVVFTISFLTQLVFYLSVYLKVPLYKPKIEAEAQQNFPPVSVVICARNEEANLEKFLPTVLEQDYPRFEVIVVNDCSYDDSEFVLSRFQKIYPNLKVTHIKPDEKFSHGKKLALTVGIKAAQHEWLVLTDADCQPASSAWLKNIARHFTDTTQVVLGYGGYKTGKGFLNKLIRFDALFVALNYLGMALSGKPYMGVGRNLAYRKELFFRNRGFASHSFLHSGDDDLFVHEVANGKNTAVEIDAQSRTLSIPRETFGSWMLQKRRHISTGPFYRNSVKAALMAEPLSRILFWFSGVTLLAMGVSPWIIGSALLFRLIVVSIILKAAMNRLSESKLFLISFLHDLLSPILYLWLAIANRFNKKQFRWN